MAATRLNIEAFLEAARATPVLDVRSPGEYAQAHIPGAHSLPLFTDEQRALIGTAYKQQSRKLAIKIGLDAFGPNMRRMVETVEAIAKKCTAQKVLVHCWRGGMRSEAVAWLLDLYGFDVCLLDGGYKAYRQWVISHWQKPVSYCILGGYTGSGKTPVLHALQEKGEAVLDLEGIAQHKGSAFGGLDRVPQPTQEMFENKIAAQIQHLSQTHPGKKIWVEDESQRIGNLNIPNELVLYFNTQPLVVLQIAFEARLDHITNEYARHSTESILNGILRIKKRLGGLETKTAVNYLIEGNTKESFRVLLCYYDKHYAKALDSKPAGRHKTIQIPFASIDPETISATLINSNP